MLPIEKNARRLVVLAQHSGAATSNELRGQFEKVTALAGPAFYEALRYAKEQRWLVLRSDNDRLVYSVDSQAVQLEEPPDDEGLPDWSLGSNANGADVAVSTLVQIVSDTSASPRQRIKAAGAVLGYQVQDDGVIEFVKGFLQSVCVSADIAIDHRIEASELLRKHEAPRVLSEIIRPNYRDDAPTEPVEPLMDLLARRRERQDRLEREMALQLAAERTSELERGGD